MAEPRPGPGQPVICLRVAQLCLSLDAQGTEMRMAVPAEHARFLAGSADGGLELSIRDGRLRKRDAWRPVYAPPDVSQLWQDDRGRYVFVPGRCQPPGRQVTVDAAFRSGEVLVESGNHSGSAGPGYPLDGIETMLFANWLAGSGDLILHAAGVEWDGRGYAFAGASGAGKSTLAGAFAEVPGSTILGEDTLVLRHLEGRFWIFGTPWHLDAARCSPHGAPLDTLYFLDRTAGSGTWPCPPLDGIARLMQTAFVPYYRPEAVARILDNLALLAEEVPFFRLGYRLGSDPTPLVRDK